MKNHLSRRDFLSLASQSTLAPFASRMLIRPGLAAAGALGAATSLMAQEATIELWWSSGYMEIGDYFNANIVEPFEQANPGVNLEFSFDIDEELERKIPIAMQAGAGPDIFMGNGPSHVQAVAQEGWLVELDDYAEQYGWDEKFQAWALDTGRVNGKLYALPNSVDQTCFYYNESLFEDMGWTVPTTRSELEAVAQAAMDEGIIPFAGGTADCPLCVNWLVAIFFNHYAGPDAVHAALTGATSFADPLFVEAIELLNSYMQQGWYAGGVAQFFATTFGTVRAQLLNREAAMSMEGTWFIPWMNSVFSESDQNWNWVPNPSLRDEVQYPVIPLGSGTTLSITTQSEHVDIAAAFLDSYYQDTATIGQRIADHSSYFIAPLNFQEGDFPAELDPRVRKFFDLLADGNLGYSPWSFWPARTHNYLYEEVQKVFTGDLSPGDYCQGMAAQFAEELEAGAVPPVFGRG